MVAETADELEAMGCRVLAKAGASVEYAAVVAQHLIRANASGVHSHGVVHLPGYVRDIKQGLLQPTAIPTGRSVGPSSVLVDGHWGFGQVAALDALDRAMDLADSAGTAAGLVACHHLGRLGHYAELAADRGYASLIRVGGSSEEDPHAAPYRGRKRLLGTSPVAFRFRGGQTNAVTYDFATMTVADMKLVTTRDRTDRPRLRPRQVGSPLAVDGCLEIVGRLLDSDLPESDIKLMTSRNPARLIGLS
jgi:LDH2 family malate/lactate/ureidoglycolate dehydrogenase